MMEEKEVMTTENTPVRIGIGVEQLREAAQTLRKYKQGKANLEQRVIDNEEWYRLRHWECLRQGSKKQQVEPVSAWLLNSIANKHADAMDNFPAPNILPREPGDVKEARQLSAIVPVVLEQAGFEATYSEGWWDKIIGGTAIYGVFWDGSKLGGLGDIAVEPVDILNLFWEPGVTKIQNSANVFHVKLEDNAALEQAYPELSGKLGGNGLDISKYVYDDTVDTTEKSVVVDWYYKKRLAARRCCTTANSWGIRCCTPRRTRTARAGMTTGNIPSCSTPCSV